MPYELYKFLKLDLLKKTNEIFTIADASIVSVVGIIENILVRIGELNSSSSITIEIFTFSVRNAIEICHLTPPPKPRKKSLHQLQESKGKKSPGRKAKMRKTPRGRSSDEKGTRNTPIQSKGEKKKISLNTEKKKKRKKKEPDEASTQKKRMLKCLSLDGLLGKLIVLKNVLRHNENIDTHLMARKKSNPLAKGKTKAHRPPLRASPRLAGLQSRGKVPPQLQAPDVSAENIPMPILPPKKCLTYRMAGEGSSRKGTKLPCRRSQRIAALHRAKSQASAEHEVIAFSSNSLHEKNGNLEADTEGALPGAEGGAEEIVPKNDVYDALWAMLDAESENKAEEIPSQWDLDSVLNNWGKIELNMGLAGNYQGPPPAAN
ncbi:hypothetical protein PIB30_047408 [Stylosanthes scabra]|uniref:Uncharacterized protein n=1 Tax=Stylosanthes scabra TaxID=79078 RepID=A0ABU6RGS7_9FABA|nr:hypothetical protein [Stylosanthes scabra]